MHGHPRPVEPDEHRFSLDALHPEADQVGESIGRRGRPDHLDPIDGESGVDHGLQLVSGVCGLLEQGSAALGGQRLGSGTEGQQRGHGLEPGAPSPLLLAADQQGIEARAPPDHQRARTGYATELVRTDAHQVGVEGAEVAGHVATGGGRIDVDKDSRPAAELDDLAHGLKGAHLVIAPLAVHQGGAGPVRRTEPLGQRIDVEAAREVDAQSLDGRQPRRGVAHGGMLDRGTQHGRPGEGPGGSPRRGVDRLGPAGGEHHLATGHAKQARHLLTRLLDGGADGPALLVDAAGVARTEGRPPRQRGECLRSWG